MWLKFWRRIRRQISLDYYTIPPATQAIRSRNRLLRLLNTRTFLYITKCRWPCLTLFHCNIYTVEAAVRDHLKCQYFLVANGRWLLRSGSKDGALGGKMILVFLMSDQL